MYYFAKYRVFINFVDHGGSDILAMPYGPFLYKQDLQNTLYTMYDKKMYKDLVFYVEACESGSMFQNLPRDLNIYVTTAANATESSWGTYCPPNDIVYFNNISKHIGSCLGDLYSVNWMQNVDQLIATGDFQKETLESQYILVKDETTLSHVQQFGDLNIDKDLIDNYEGDTTTHNTPYFQYTTQYPINIKQHDASLYSTLYTYLYNNEYKTLLANKLFQMIYNRQQIDLLFKNYTLDMCLLENDYLPCTKKFYHTIQESSCGTNSNGSLSHALEYALSYSKHITQICFKNKGLLNNYYQDKIAALNCWH